MAFYKKQQQAVNKKWYPRSVLVGSSISTDQISKRIAKESTVAPADVKAVLTALSGVMGDYMALGRSVKLDGIGSFSFMASATGNGVENEEDVSAKQINGVKVHFVPETTYKRGGGGGGKGRRAVRALTDVDIEWIDVASLNVTGKQSAEEEEDSEENTGGNGGSGSSDDNGLE